MRSNPSFLSRLFLAVILLSATAAVQAAPQAFQDVRALGMGGTGVAAARPSGAALFNPALLAAEHREAHDGFAVTAPSVNAQYADGEDVIEQVDQIESTIDRLDAAINAGNTSVARNEAGVLADQLEAISGDTVRGGLGAGVLLAKPSPSLAIGLHATAQGRGTVRSQLDASEVSALRDFADGTTGSVGININDLNSEGRVLGGGVGEVGLSLAHAFDFSGLPLSLGVTPKVVQMRTLDSASSLSDFDKDGVERLDPTVGDDNETHKSFFNFDVGASTTLGSGDHWRLGASVRNVIPKTLKTAPNNGSNFFGREKMQLDPMVTVGIAHSSGWHTLTADVDLTKNEGMENMADRQFLSVGGEFNLIDWVNLRVGARKNLAQDDGANGIEEDEQITAGFALSPGPLRIEAAALYGSEDELGAGLEAGFSF